jgi:hypothetical protein
MLPKPIAAVVAQPDEHGNLLCRAGGGHKWHIISKDELVHGNDATAMCGHQPRHSHARNMKRRAKWYHTFRPVGECTCEKCAKAYERKYP